MAFGGNLDDSDEMVSEINMTPLVDVMLVLLIIFIITVPVLTHSVNIDLPRAQNQAAIIKPQTVTISITANSQIYWNDTLVDQTNLETHLHTAARLQPQPEIHIRGDRKVNYEQVMKVMAAVQRSGIAKLGFITEPNN